MTAWSKELKRHRRGVNHENAKLDDRKVREIRKLLEIGAWSMGKIGRAYKVDWTSIRQVRDRVTWAHVT